MISPWPQVQSGSIDPDAEQELEAVMAVVRACEPTGGACPSPRRADSRARICGEASA